jgi:membrane protein YdbS with pleckstrin-like domain/ribosomal protein L12E/L44/L45/RPP1/RPP2
MDELTNQGIEALKIGDRARARYLLRTALEKNLDNLQAWMWLSGAVELDEEKLECLQQVMRIDPGNPTAARGIAKLTGKDVADVLAESAAAAVEAATSPPSPDDADHAREMVASMANEQPAMAVPAPAGEVEMAGSQQETSAVEPAEAMAVSTSAPGEPVAEPVSEAAPARPLPDLENEGEPVFRTRPSLLSTLLLMFFTPVLLFIILLSALPQLSGETFFFPAVMLVIIAVVLFFIWRIISLLSTRYTVTTAAIVISRGAFRRTRQVIPLQEIRQVTCQRNLFQRLSGTGSILITTKTGDSEEQVKLADVANCAQRVQHIEKLLSGV